MLKTKYLLAVATLLLLITPILSAQDRDEDYDNPRSDYYYADRSSIDRYLDVEVWTDHSDADYYIGDDVVINFRVNRDAFVVIYSVDSRGMVNLIFPADPAQDNFVYGGVNYSLPGPADDYNLVLNGPEGSEMIQVIASRERFPVPDWYRNSGLVFEGDEIYDYMDYLNGRYFVRYDGQRFAYDRAAIFVNEWEPDYFRPVYYPDYPSWSVVGNVYVDYAWGSSVYINGYYWGVTPLYIPRLLVGWHTMTIYDSYGYGWENDFHVSRYHTSVFDHNVIIPVSSMRSKYKSVRTVGYRNPVDAYPRYKQRVAARQTTLKAGSRSKIVGSGSNRTAAGSSNYVGGQKRFVRGDSKVVKTERGYETRSVIAKKSQNKSSKSSRSRNYSSRKSSGDSKGSTRSFSSGTSKSSRSSSGSGSSRLRSGSTNSGSSDYYKQKSGQKSSGSSRSSVRSKSSNSGSSSKGRSIGSAARSKSSKSSKSRVGSKTKRSTTTRSSAPAKVKQSRSGGKRSSSTVRQSSTGSKRSSSSGRSSQSSSGSGKRKR